MLDRLLDILSEYDGIEYRILEAKGYGVESYYVKKQLEMNRCVDATHIYLTVYKTFSEDGKTYRGSYLMEIHPDSTREEIVKAIDDAREAAGFVKNEWYPLVSPLSRTGEKPCGGAAESGVSLIESDFAGQSLYESLEKLKNAFYVQDKHTNGYLSYAEFNLKKIDVRIINSQGVDVAYTCYGAEMETSVNWRENEKDGKDAKEIEIYEAYKLANCDTGLLEEHIERLFDVASQKLQASPTPGLKDINVLLTGECLKTFFSYYYINACAESVYNNRSTFKTGEDLQGADDACDKITMTLEPRLQGSTGSRPWDMDGFPLAGVRIIEQGKLLRYWGDMRFSSLLGVEPTGRIDNFIVSGGSQTVAEMKKAPYLELVSFSDFQTDPVTGDFASEIRLGFYYDGKTVLPVTGGSVSGNIKKVHGNMKMSVETRQYNNYEGPSTICIQNAVIAGCKP